MGFSQIISLGFCEINFLRIVKCVLVGVQIENISILVLEINNSSIFLNSKRLGYFFFIIFLFFLSISTIAINFVFLILLYASK